MPDETPTLDRGADGDFSPDPDRYLPEAPPGYELIRRLGTGGMGTVYLAREQAAERTVAMKLLNAPGSPTAFERFLVEARALARLDHPNIIKIIAVETHWREPFLTMEYADGGSLADLAEPDRLPAPADAARLVLAAAEAVSAAHAAGILHRDIKPSNILLKSARGQEPGVRSQGSGVRDPSSLTPDPWLLTPVVSDFGLAKRTDRSDGLTRTGPIGTPRYMSPEAAAGRFQEVGPPADVYGLGATLYHLLTGQPPFAGDGPDEVIRKVLRDPLVRPRALRPELSAELEAVVVHALEKDPAKRYPTAAALADDLRRFLAGDAPAARVLSPRRRAGRWLARHRGRIATAVGVAVLAAVLVVGGWYLRPGAPADPEQAIRAEIAAGKVAALLGPDGRPRAAAWPLGFEDIAATAEDGGTLSFGSNLTRIRVLLLLSDPGVDSYRLEADLWQVQKIGNVLTDVDKSTNEVGLVLGYAGQPGAGGTRVHTQMVFAFQEFDPADVRRELQLMDVGLVTMPDLTPWPVVPTYREVPSAPLARLNPAGPGWRRVSVEVSPAGVRVPGRGGRTELADPAGIALRRNGPVEWPADCIRDQVARSAAGPVTLPDWSPRMPLGIWCRGSWVAVRNVTIQALK
jgi:hypothetical protein